MFTPSLLLAATVALGPVLAAQSLAATPPRGPSLGAPAIPDAEYVRSMLERAGEAAVGGHPQEARKIYLTLVGEQRRANQFAGEALWQLALNYLYANRSYQAAQTLDDLVLEADRYGDPARALRASFESAVLWQQLKRPEMVQARLARVKDLLHSPAVADDDKRYVTERLGTEPQAGTGAR